MTSVKCEHCGLVNWLADEACRRCGAELKSRAASFNHAASGHQIPPSGIEGSEAKQEGLKPGILIGPFNGVGEVLSPTFELFKNNIWLITKIVFVIFAPFEIFKALSFGTKETGWQVAAGTFILGLVCKALVAPSLIYALVTVMRTGVAPSLNESYRWGLSRLGRLVACALMAWVLQLLGFICLIIPGIILGLAFELIYPMAALENRTPVEILKRSYNLTEGYRMRIFAAGLVLGLICSFVVMPAGIAAGVLDLSEINFWPLEAALSLIADVANESTTILSLVIYISIVSHTSPEQASPATPVTDSR
jgi:hypothetical protein